MTLFPEGARDGPCLLAMMPPPPLREGQLWAPPLWGGAQGSSGFYSPRKFCPQAAPWRESPIFLRLGKCELWEIPMFVSHTAPTGDISSPYVCGQGNWDAGFSLSCQHLVSGQTPGRPTPRRASGWRPQSPFPTSLLVSPLPSPACITTPRADTPNSTDICSDKLLKLFLCLSVSFNSASQGQGEEPTPPPQARRLLRSPASRNLPVFQNIPC